MAKTKEQKPDAAGTEQQKPVDIQNDEHRGQGGSYVFDPETGKRTRIAGPALDEQSAVKPESIDPEVLNNEIQ